MSHFKNMFEISRQNINFFPFRHFPQFSFIFNHSGLKCQICLISYHSHYKKYVWIFAPKINIYRPFLTSSTKYLNFRAKNETFGVCLIKSFLKNVESLIGRWCSCWCKSLIYGMAIGYQGDLSVKKSISSSICWNPFGNEVSLAYFFSNQNLISSVDHFNPFFRHKNSTVASKLRHVRNSCLNALFPSTQ